MSDTLTLPDGSTITMSSKLLGGNANQKFPGNVLKPKIAVYDTPSGQVRVEVDALYTPASPPPPPSNGPPSGAPFPKQVWFDGFVVGAPSDWATGKLAHGVTAPWNSEETACYDPANVTVQADGLHLKLTSKSQAGYMYSGACVNTNGKVAFKVGQYAEATVILPVFDGIPNWPQWWSDGQNWPQDGEIDMFEGLGGHLAYHYHGPQNGGAGFGGDYPGALGGVEHAIGAYRNPNGNADFYLDGKHVGSESEQGVTADHYLILVNSCGQAGGNTMTNVPDMIVRSVGIWTP